MTQQEKNEIIVCMLQELDRHSPGERAHADRVAVYAVATGEALGMSDAELVELRYAAQLHDVGKVRVDASLLGKLGRLTTEELFALRLHAELALTVLDDHAFLRPSLPSIRHHHERWDGGGYPDQLSGASIPLGARLIAVAETFDTLTFPPAWARGLSEPEALAEIEGQSGAQFDPAAVRAFLDVQPLIQPIGL